MKTLIAVLVLLLIPVSMPVRGETITLLEIDTAWGFRSLDAGPNVDTIGVVIIGIDTIPHWIDPAPIWEWIQKQQRPQTMFYFHDTTPRVDTVIVHDTICPCDHEWEWEYECYSGFAGDWSVTGWFTRDEYHARGSNCGETGNSRCIYCGKQRTRKGGE